jgi:hypothetical protein
MVLIVAPKLPHLSVAHRRLLDGAQFAVLMVVLSPTCWDATYSALLLPLAIALMVWTADPGRWWRNWTLDAGLLLLAGLSVLLKASAWRALGMKQYHGETYVYLVFMILPWLALTLLWCLWQERRLLARRSA